MTNPLPILLRILKAPSITLKLNDSYYDVCTMRHPKLKIIPNKVYLVALMDEYHRDGYEIRKSLRCGNEFRMFKPFFTHNGADIVNINRSNPVRQGKQLPAYMNNEFTYKSCFEGRLLYGIYKGDRLIAYADVVKYGDVNVIGPFMGHADYLKEGIMYQLFDQFAINRPLMYDTFLGNTKGLTYFKRKLGFVEYNVKWQRE